MASEYELIDEFVEITDEDTLTKSVFGSLQLLDEESLNQIFSSEKFDFEFSESPEFTFHEYVDNKIPDVVVEGDQVTLLIEAKRGDDTNPEQLSKEYDDLESEYNTPTRRILHITDDITKPSVLDSDDRLPSGDIIWLNWRELSDDIIQLRDTKDVTEVQDNVLGLTVEALEKDGYVPFEGFTLMNKDKELSETLEQAHRVRDRYAEEIKQLHNDVRHNLDNIEYWKFFNYGFKGSRGGRDNMPKSVHRISPHYWFAYNPTEYTSPEEADNTNKENYLFLDFDTTSGRVRAGYTMNTEPGQIEGNPHIESLHENREKVLGILEENDLDSYTAEAHYSIIKSEDDGIRNFLELIGNDEYDDDRAEEVGKRFLIAKEWSPEEVPVKLSKDEKVNTDDFVEDIVSAIEKINEITYSRHPEIFYPRRD